MKKRSTQPQGSGPFTGPPPAVLPGVKSYAWPAAQSRVIHNTKFTRPLHKRFGVRLMDEGLETDWPEVQISETANAKMWALVQECPIEVSWLCTVSRTTDGNFLVEDVFVPTQMCTISTTEVSTDGDAEMLTTLLSAGRASDVNKLHCWGHSHVNMEVFASGVDAAQTDDYLEKRSDFFLRFIANKRGELLCTLYLIDEGVILNNPVMQVPEIKADFKDWAKEEVKAKVSQQTFTAVNHCNSGMHYNLQYLSKPLLDRWLRLKHIDKPLYDSLLTDVNVHPKPTVATTAKPEHLDDDDYCYGDDDDSGY